MPDSRDPSVPEPSKSGSDGDRFQRVGGRMLFARFVDLKRTANNLDAAGDGLLLSLWNRQAEDERWAWEALWVGLVRNGWDGFFTPAREATTDA